MFRKITSLILIVVFAIFASGCATIVSGPTQSIPITTNPSGATVTIDGRSKVTPAVFQLPKNQTTYFVKIEKDGYNKVEVDLVRGMSGWFFCNIFFGWLLIVGMPVDLISTAGYKYTPVKIDETLNLVSTPAQPAKKEETKKEVHPKQNFDW